MELFISIFENSLPKGSFRQNKISYEILQLSADSRQLQSGPLKEVVQNNENKLHGLLPALKTSRSNLENTPKLFYVQRPKSLNYVPDLQFQKFPVDFVFYFVFFNKSRSLSPACKSQFCCNVFMFCFCYSFLLFFLIDQLISG